jgi:type III secretory pathway component EscT
MNATSRKFALEAVVFMLLGGVCLSLLNRMRVHTSYPPTDNVLMGVGIGFVSGLIIWSLYRMVRFVITG